MHLYPRGPEAHLERQEHPPGPLRQLLKIRPSSNTTLIALYVPQSAIPSLSIHLEFVYTWEHRFRSLVPGPSEPGFSVALPSHAVPREPHPAPLVEVSPGCVGPARSPRHASARPPRVFTIRRAVRGRRGPSGSCHSPLSSSSSARLAIASKCPARCPRSRIASSRSISSSCVPCGQPRQRLPRQML